MESLSTDADTIPTVEYLTSTIPYPSSSFSSSNTDYSSFSASSRPSADTASYSSSYPPSLFSSSSSSSSLPLNDSSAYSYSVSNADSTSTTTSPNVTSLTLPWQPNVSGSTRPAPGSDRFPPGGIAGILCGGIVFIFIVLVVLDLVLRKKHSTGWLKSLKCFRPKKPNRKSYDVTQFVAMETAVPTFPVQASGYPVFHFEEEKEEEAKELSHLTDLDSGFPPPVPPRIAIAGGSSPFLALAHESEATTVNHVFPEEVISPSIPDPEEDDTLEQFPDEMAPPPPRDSCFMPEEVQKYLQLATGSVPLH